MEQISVIYDSVGNALTVWFGNPADEDVAEETGEGVILMKDGNGQVIGFEKLNFAHEPGTVNVRFESLNSPINMEVS